MQEEDVLHWPAPISRAIQRDDEICAKFCPTPIRMLHHQHPKVLSSTHQLPMVIQFGSRKVNDTQRVLVMILLLVEHVRWEHSARSSAHREWLKRDMFIEVPRSADVEATAQGKFAVDPEHEELDYHAELRDFVRRMARIPTS